MSRDLLARKEKKRKKMKIKRSAGPLVEEVCAGKGIHVGNSHPVGDFYRDAYFFFLFLNLFCGRWEKLYGCGNLFFFFQVLVELDKVVL